MSKSPQKLSVFLLFISVFSLGFTVYYSLQVQQSSSLSAMLKEDLWKGKLKSLYKENKRLRDKLKQTETSLASAMKKINSSNTVEPCTAAYNAANQHRTRGLTEESLVRSRANIGNQQRLNHVAETLLNGTRALNVISFGGSITLAHGVIRNLTLHSGSYTDLLEVWLNQVYPTSAHEKHRIFNLAGHGADICSLAKRITTNMVNLARDGVTAPDMFILEFAVNDYQGQDHVNHAVNMEDVFFHGFDSIALCAEVVVNKLLRTYPNAAVLFFEFRSGIPQRKTAQMLHMGVAQHYQVPVISYADAMFPEFFRLVSMLNASDHYTVPKGETLLPFPYGCHSCRPALIIEQFRNSFNPKGIKHCRTICDIMTYAGQECPLMEPPGPGRDYCYPAIFAVDAVHPSAVGQRIATDLLVHAISSAVKDRCQKKPLAKHVLPSEGWLGKPRSLEARAKFVLVQDTDCPTTTCDDLVPSFNSPGFALYSDSVGFEKPGWIATSPRGGEVIEFEINLPHKPCYVVYLAILRSYVGMGMMEVTVVDNTTKNETTMELDALWETRISVWSDNQVTSDEASACTGQCLVRIRTKPQASNRTANKVKLLTLSVRECI